MTGGLLGLASWLFFLDRRPDVLEAAWVASCLMLGRIGDEFRDVRGLLPVDGGREAIRLFDGCFCKVGIEVEDVVSRFSVGLTSLCVLVRDTCAGSAVSERPVIEAVDVCPSFFDAMVTTGSSLLCFCYATW